MAVASGVKQAPMQLYTEDGIITPDCGRKTTFDNIDYHQNVHYMSEDHQNIDKHYVTYTSTENRVSGNHLSDQTPLGGIKEMENGKCQLPMTMPNKGKITLLWWKGSLQPTFHAYIFFLRYVLFIYPTNILQK